MGILENHAPIKKKLVRGNNSPFVNRTLTKAFMHRSKLKNKFNKNSTEENKQAYTRQRNYCVGLVKREKKSYFNNLDLKILNDNRKFWKKIKPLFSDKQKNLHGDIILIENETTISKENEVAEK